MIAQVAVSAAVYAIDKPYSYRFSAEKNVCVGMRVTVPFGRSNRRSEAIVLAVSEGSEDGLKCIEQVMDEVPILSQRDVKIAAFLRERYFCTFYDAIRAILPSGVWLASTVVYEIADTPNDLSQIERSNPDSYKILSTLIDCGGQMDRAHLIKLLSLDEVQFDAAVRYLTSKKILRSNAEIARRSRDKTEKIVSLAVPAEEAMKFAQRKKSSAPLQYQVLQMLASVGCGNSKEICYYTGASNATLRRLEDLGYIQTHVSDVFRSPLPAHVPPAEPFQLNIEQTAAFSALLQQAETPNPGCALLYGVTGSGKTAVYIRMIQETLAKGRSAILLVPEISLTPQLITLLMSHFSKLVAVLHSGLRVTERYDEWKRIRSGLARVVVGTRSAVFAPAKDLGLIIIDEEQEHTYKSENSPRYHTREVALYRGVKEHSLVILGSATPSVETMYKAKSGDYSFVTLTRRYNGRELPSTQLVDLKEELLRGNSTSISTPLRNAMIKAFQEDKQSILFLNRRGAGRYMICVSCGEVPACPRCSVNLTYHSANHRLMCHHCGHSEAAEDRCPKCGNRYKIMGTGTQKVEQELKHLFPDKTVLRMDADTISASSNHEMLLSRFENEHIPILLGTQMITKGLNFQDVTVVGVLDADQALYAGNYRAAEQAFSMVTQVVGRSGRGVSDGCAYIQTMTPDHSVIKLAAAQDYDQFYDLEITMRQMLRNPPFSDLFQISFIGPYDGLTYAGASRFKNALVSSMHTGPYAELDAHVLGPAPATVLKVNNTYRYRLTLSCANQKPIRLLIAHLLRTFAQDKQNRGISAFADVNPYE